MNNKGSSYLRKRHQTAHDKGNHVLDVTNMESDGTGSKVIPDSGISDKYLKSKDYYIVSLDENNYDKAIKAMDSSSSTSRIKTPVLKRPKEQKVNITDLPPETLENIFKYLSPDDLIQSSKSDNKFIRPSRRILTHNKIVTIKYLDDVDDYLRNNVRKINYTGYDFDICKLSNFPKLIFLENAGKHNNSFIIKASEEGCLYVVKFLASLDSVDPSDQDNEAILIASKNGHLEVVKFLASLPSVNNKSNYSYKSISKASKNGHLEVVKFLANKVSSDDASEVIIGASENGHLEVVKFLSTLPSIDAGIHHNEAIIRASKNGHLEVVEFLSSLHSVDAGDQWNQSIKKAIKNGHLEVVKLLSKLDSVVFYNDYILEAIHFDQLEIVKFLISMDGANAAWNDNTLIIYASRIGKIDIVEFLASFDSVNPGARDNEAIIKASKNGHLEVVEFLSSLHSVDPYARNNEAIIEARNNEQLEVVEFLKTLYYDESDDESDDDELIVREP
jgi:ankyrin repeat protein